MRRSRLGDSHLVFRFSSLEGWVGVWGWGWGGLGCGFEVGVPYGCALIAMATREGRRLTLAVILRWVFVGRDTRVGPGLITRARVRQVLPYLVAIYSKSFR